MSAPYIMGTGRCVPKRIVTNDELSQRVDTSDEWIFTRTGIRERHFCTDETACDIASTAARQAIERSGIAVEEIGVCIVATITPDYASPSAACMLQRELGLLEDTICFDLNGACAGFLYSLNTAHALLATAKRPYALIVGCEILSRLMDMDDRDTCVLFGDGAGAAVIRRDNEETWHTVFGSRGDDQSIRVGGLGRGRSTIHMEGSAVFRFAVETVGRSIDELLEADGITIDDVDLVVCHQANARIVDAAAKRMKAREGQFYKNMVRYGNTSAASIPITLDELVESGKLQRGMKVLCVGFGGGLTWESVIFRW